ncbi:MAG: hypothetical protein ACRDAX_01100, partial [Propionibacteriaceae bacterium]
DLHISRETNKFTFKVYRKPTDRGILLNYKSNHSYNTKATVVRAGILRAYEYCEDKSLRRAELKNVYEILYQNDYPQHFIDKVHHKVKVCYKRKMAKLNTPAANATQTLAPVCVQTDGGVNATSVSASAPRAPAQRPSILNIPYVPGVSELIHKAAKKNFDNMRVVFSCKNNLRKSLMHVKPKKKPLLKNCVYKIKCECNAVYIGQTRRNLSCRLKEHKEACKTKQNESNRNHNKLALHAQKMNHNFDFKNAAVIHFEQNFHKRIVAESMAMVACEKAISQSSRNIDKIFWQSIKDDGKIVSGKNYFSEKARLDDVTNAQCAITNVRKRVPTLPRPQRRPAAHSYDMRIRAT